MGCRDAKKSHPNVRFWGPLGAPAQCANAPLAPFAGKDILTFPAGIPHGTVPLAEPIMADLSILRP